MDNTTAATGTPEITLDCFGKNEARDLKEILTRFLHEYGEKAPEVSDEDWLCQRFQAELPDMGEEKARQVSRETIESVQKYDENRASLSAARARGQTTEDWFADRSRELAAGVPAAVFGHEMGELGKTISEINRQMADAVTTQNGVISQQLNLDGYLAEQHAVNSFNAAAKLSNSPYTAKVCRQGAGKTYGKNSFDAVIVDGEGKIVHQYQFKYGKDAEATIQMLKRGNYNNQTIVVPPEQVKAVQDAFPGKTVVSEIGGTEKVPVTSAPLSKADAKAMQEEIQRTGKAPTADWNFYDDRMLGKYVGKQVVTAGVQGAALATGFSLAEKLISEEPIEPEEVVVDALRTGADASVKAAAAGALTVAVEKGTLGTVAKVLPVPAITNIA